MKEHSIKDDVGHFFAVVPESELYSIMTGTVRYLTRLPLELEPKRGDVIFLSSEFAAALVRCAIEVLEVLEMTPMAAFGRFKAALPANFNDNWSICSKVTLIRIGDVRVLDMGTNTAFFGVKTSKFYEARGRLVRINKPIGYKGNCFYTLRRRFSNE